MKTNVLIVDDEAGIREMFRETLEERGYSCLTAPSAEVALELLSGHTVDVLLLDILMPEMNGLTCFEYIRERYPDVAVVFVTAMDDVSVGVDTMRAGAYDYLVKPTTARRLEEAVEGVLAKRRRLLAERQQREVMEQEQTQQISQRSREIAALNHMFQQHLGQYFEVVKAYQSILDGLAWLERSISARYEQARSQLPLVQEKFPGSRSSLEPLTDRQREVLELMAQGYSNETIAQKLTLTEESVEEHIRGVYQQLDLSLDDVEYSRVKAVLIYLSIAP